MKIQYFVTLSALFFATWLTVTYVRDVPRENYPRLGKGSLPVSAKTEAETPNLPEEDEEPAMQVAFSE